MPDEPRRSTVDAAGQQVGEQQISAAGENIYHGLGGGDLRQILHQQTEFYTALVTAYERQYREFARGLDEIREWHEAREIMDERRRKAELEEREQRRKDLDDALAAINDTAARHAAELARLRRASITGGLILLGIIAVVAVLVSREAGWLARAAVDAALLWRPRP